MTTLVIPDLVGWAALIGAAAALLGWLFKGFTFVKEPENLKNEIVEIKSELAAQKAEMRMLYNGVLASLKGLHEQGANGPVTQTIAEMEQYLNDAAHKSKE